MHEHQRAWSGSSGRGPLRASSCIPDINNRSSRGNIAFIGCAAHVPISRAGHFADGATLVSLGCFLMCRLRQPSARLVLIVVTVVTLHVCPSDKSCRNNKCCRKRLSHNRMPDD